MSKVEGGGVRLTPPPPSRLRVSIFSSRLLGLKLLYVSSVIYETTVALSMCCTNKYYNNLFISYIYRSFSNKEQIKFNTIQVLYGGYLK